MWAELKEAFTRLSVMGSYVGERRASDTNILENGNRGAYYLDPYVMLDATLSSTPMHFGDSGEMVVRLMARNLMDTQASDPGEAGVDFPLAPRTLTLQLNVIY